MHDDRFRRVLIRALQSLQSSIDKNTDAVRENSASQESTTEPPAEMIVQSVVSLPPAIQSCYEAEWRERPIKERRERIKRRIEYSGVALLAVYTFFTIKMYVANKEAAEAAMGAADTAKTALISVQRAFINFSEVRSERLVKFVGTREQRSWQFQARWLNTGTTRAIAVSQFFNMGDGAEPTEAQFQGDPAIPVPTRVGPGGILESGKLLQPYAIIPVPVVLTNRIQAVDMAGRWYFWGWVAYRDVFPKTEVHVNEFCQHLRAVQVKSADLSFNFGFDLCKEHNCEDSDCKDYGNIVDIWKRCQP